MDPKVIKEIGNWSEIKLQIVKDYAAAYSKILANQSPLKHVYVDAFAGAGVHTSKITKDVVLGSPLNALYTNPPFKELHLIDLDGDKIDWLRTFTQGNDNVHLYNGDCNAILINQVFPQLTFQSYKRAICLLDPYGLHLKWDVIKTAADLGTIEIFLNFPTMDMNRNALLKNIEAIDPNEAARMTAFWGDESWRSIAYAENPQQNLFGVEDPLKQSNEKIAEEFRKRLKDVAGFKFVPDPIPMKNSKGAIVYYLFFASQNETGNKIATHILNKQRKT
ncbi:MAG: three-Cys-motif partner protein TcmP [Pyrinomonadaceae bacterium]